jgi:hypothetical protein
MTKESNVYFGFSVADISSVTTGLFLSASRFAFGVSISATSSDNINNYILYVLDVSNLTAFIIKSLYLFSRISLVKLLGTPNLKALLSKAIGSILLIQVLKLTSVSSPLIIFKVFSQISLIWVFMFYPPVQIKKIFYVKTNNV